MKRNLLPCPFCGLKKYLEFLYDEPTADNPGTQVICIRCQAAGPLIDDCYTPYSNEEEAIKAWNGRK